MTQCKSVDKEKTLCSDEEKVETEILKGEVEKSSNKTVKICFWGE